MKRALDRGRVCWTDRAQILRQDTSLCQSASTFFTSIILIIMLNSIVAFGANCDFLREGFSQDFLLSKQAQLLALVSESHGIRNAYSKYGFRRSFSDEQPVRNLSVEEEDFIGRMLNFVHPNGAENIEPLTLLTFYLNSLNNKIVEMEKSLVGYYIRLAESRYQMTIEPRAVEAIKYLIFARNLDGRASILNAKSLRSLNVSLGKQWELPTENEVQAINLVTHQLGGQKRKTSKLPVLLKAGFIYEEADMINRILLDEEQLGYTESNNTCCGRFSCIDCPKSYGVTTRLYDIEFHSVRQSSNKNSGIPEQVKMERSKFMKNRPPKPKNPPFSLVLYRDLKVQDDQR